MRLEGITRGYRGLQAVTQDYKELQELEEVTTGEKSLQGITRGYRRF